MPLTDVISPPAPNAGIAQSNPDTIARSLVGNDLVDKFGHAMGVRQMTPADVMRDMNLGAAIGPANVAKLHAKAQKQLADQHIEALRVGFAQEAADRAKREELLQAIKDSRNPNFITPKYAKEYLDGVAKNLGLTISPTILKQFTDAEHGLSDRTTRQVADTINTLPWNEVATILPSISAAQKLIGEANSQVSTQMSVSNAVLENTKKRLDIQKLQTAPVPLTPRQQGAQKEYERLSLMRVPKTTVDPETGAAVKTWDFLPKQAVLDQLAAGPYGDMFQEQGLGSSSADGMGGDTAPAPILGMPPKVATPATPATPAPLPFVGGPVAVPQAPATPSVQELSVPKIRGIIQQ